MEYPWFEVRPSRERDVSDHPSELVVHWNVNQASIWSLDDRSLRELRDALDGYLVRITFGGLPDDREDQTEADERGERHRMRFAGPECRRLAAAEKLPLEDTWQPPYDE